MIKNIIFDFDGTIANSFDVACEIGSKMSNKYNLPITEEEMKFILRHKGYKELIKKFDISKLKLISLAYQYRKESKDITEKIKPFTEIIPVLKKLKKQNYKLGIISSNSKENINKFLKNNNLEVFDFVIQTSLFGKAKTLNEVIKKYNLKKSETLYLGDEKRDIRACRKINLKVIALSYGYSSKMLLKEENPQVIIDSPKQIIPAIKKLT